MRILFLESSQIWIYGLPNGFVDNGHTVIISGPLTEMNIKKMLDEFKPDLAITIGWGVENTPIKQQWISKSVHEAKVPLVYWAIEDPAYTEIWSLPLIKNLQPNFVFTLSPAKVDFYKQHGIASEVMDFGYHSSIHYPVSFSSQYHSEIAIVANAYPDILEKYADHYRLKSLNTLLRPLLHKNICVDFWGRDWDKMKPYLGIDIPKDWIHGYLPYKYANQVYSSSDIVIGLQNYSSQVTQRTYEILASGGFLITNDTAGINKLFKPGKDLITSSTPEETVKLVEYYLGHPEERKVISDQGRISVKEHSYSNRAEFMLKVLSNHGIIKNAAPVSSGVGEIYYYENYTEDKYQLHIVSPGDTLWSISRKYNVSLSELMKLNYLNTSEILVDQVLKIRELTDPSQYLFPKLKNLDINNIPGGADAVRWAKHILSASEKHQIPGSILYAIMIVESKGNPNLVSKTGGIGLMQLQIETANWLGVNPCHPLQAIDGAARYLKELYEEFHDWKLAVAAYNVGPEPVKKYNGIPPIEEPQNYVKEVFALCEAVP